jgi:FkbM family methyltransferase
MLTKAIQSIRHALLEGHAAAGLSGNSFSAWRLRADFLLSRLLKTGYMPGADQLRQIRFHDWLVTYRFNRGDMQSLREVLVEEVYACDLPFLPGSILDLGANIGLASLWLARRYQKAENMRVLAVEASEANARVAGVNFRDNAIRGEVIHAAVGETSGEAFFAARAASNVGRIVSSANEASVRVPVVGIAELVARFPCGQVDLVKMDIEGSERELLTPRSDWLDQVRALMIEWHDDVAPSEGMKQVLLKRGFQNKPLNAHRQENLSLYLRR